MDDYVCEEEEEEEEQLHFISNNDTKEHPLVFIFYSTHKIDITRPFQEQKAEQKMTTGTSPLTSCPSVLSSKSHLYSSIII